MAGFSALISWLTRTHRLAPVLTTSARADQWICAGPFRFGSECVLLHICHVDGVCVRHLVADLLGHGIGRPRSLLLALCSAWNSSRRAGALSSKASS
jgi:hypothetical protein